MNGDEEWIESAVKDDSVVAELLIRLKNSSSAASVVFQWGGKRCRSSRQISRCKNKGGESIRNSPTTPLSWSAGTSYSGGGSGSGDAFEESSRPRSTSGRSKVPFTCETGNTHSTKRQKFAELQEEESFLKRERLDLNREFAILHKSYEGQRTINEILKRLELFHEFDVCYSGHRKISKTIDSLKVDMPFRSEGRRKGAFHDVSARPSYDQSRQRATVICNNSTIFQTTDKSNRLRSSSQPVDSCKNTRTRELLPDLNLPLEDDSSSEILYGMS